MDIEQDIKNLIAAKHATIFSHLKDFIVDQGKKFSVDFDIPSKGI